MKILTLILTTLLCFFNVIAEPVVVRDSDGNYKLIEQSENKVWLFKPKPNKNLNNQLNKHAKSHKLHKNLNIVRAEFTDKNSLLHFLADSQDSLEYLVPDRVVEITETIPNDPLWLNQWDMVKIQMPKTWDVDGNSQVIVGVFDTGVDFNHPDLVSNIYSDSNGNHGWECFNGNLVVGGLDGQGHGTHVAGTIGAIANNNIGVAGMNWNVKIISFKFLNSNGSGLFSDAIELIDKIVELKNNGVNIKVVNCSWGGLGSPDQITKDAFQKLEDVGILAVCAAGNNGVNIDLNPFTPAAIDNRGIISVQATDNNDKKAGFSNFGNIGTDIAAPGVLILSTVPTNSSLTLSDPTGYKNLSGTSMAAPHVSGLVSLLFGLNPNLTIYEVKDILLNKNSYDIVDVNFDISSTSGGRINTYKTLINSLVFNPKLNNIPEITDFSFNFGYGGQSAFVSFNAFDLDNDPLKYFIFDTSDLIPYTRTNYLSFNLPKFAFDMAIGIFAGASDGNGGSRAVNKFINVYKDPNFIPANYEIGLDFSVLNKSNLFYHTYYILNSDPNVLTTYKPILLSKNSIAQWAITDQQWFNIGYDFSTPISNIPSIVAGKIISKNTELTLKHSDKKIVKIDPLSTNNFPTINVKLNKTIGEAPLILNYDLTDTSVSSPGQALYSIFIDKQSFSEFVNPVGTLELDTPGIHIIDFIVWDGLRYPDIFKTVISVLTPTTDVGVSPFIISQPQNSEVKVGEEAEFVVNAGGTLPLNYQWYFNNFSINNETNSILLINNCDLNDIGDYKVVVVNSYGSVESQVAHLNVLSPPPPPSVILNTVTDLTASGRILLRWTDNSINETNYEIQMARKIKNNYYDFIRIATLPANSNQYLFSNLTKNTTYYFRIRACNGSVCGNYSNTATIRLK